MIARETWNKLKVDIEGEVEDENKVSLNESSGSSGGPMGLTTDRVGDHSTLAPTQRLVDLSPPQAMWQLAYFSKLAYSIPTKVLSRIFFHDNHRITT
jgi:hypothetical protein